jgi:predicted transcriptional regulator
MMSTAKEDVEALLTKLPDDCSLEDIQYRLYVIDKVRHGLEVADAQGTITQEEVEERLSTWITA